MQEEIKNLRVENHDLFLKCQENEKNESEVIRLKNEISSLKKKLKKKSKTIKNLKNSKKMSIDNKEILIQTIKNLKDSFNTFDFNLQGQIKSLDLLVSNIKS